MDRLPLKRPASDPVRALGPTRAMNVGPPLEPPVPGGEAALVEAVAGEGVAGSGNTSTTGIQDLTSKEWEKTPCAILFSVVIDTLGLQLLGS
jgi:hypothetical protein